MESIKSHFKHFAILVFFIMGVCACEKHDDVKIESFLECRTQSLEFLASSGSAEVKFSTNMDWTINSDGDWCKLSNSSGKGNKDLTIPITVTVEENKSMDSRTCNIVISTKEFNHTIAVTQLPTGALIIDQKEYVIDHSAQTVTIELKTNMDFELAIEKSCQNWIKLSQTKGLSAQTITFEISENEEDADRTGHIQFYQTETGSASETVTITQKKVDQGHGGEESLYSISSTKTFNNIDSYASVMSIDDGLKAQLPTILFMFKMIAPYYKEPVRMINIEYASSDMDGSPCRMSASVMIPEKAFTDGRTIRGLILSNPIFTIRNEDCATSIPDMFGVLTWLNYAIVIPDTYGFGVSNGHFPAYLNKDVCAYCNIDAIKAAQQLFEDNNLKINDYSLNLGYSLGAYTSLATEKYIAENPDCGISFDKTILGSGCYDILATFEDFPKIGCVDATPLIVLSSISINETEHLGIDYSNLFKGTILEKYKEWCISRSYTRPELSALFDGKTIYDIMTDDFLNHTGETYDKIKASAKKNSLVSGWTPAPGSNFFIYHSKADDYITYRCFEELQDNFEANPGDYTVTYTTSESSGHLSGALDYAIGLILPQLK